MNRSLTIVGASTRAAAQSALRAGFRPWLADLFADVDLQACGPVRRIEPYPHALLDILQSTPDAPWMYTGAIENYPALIDALASQRPLWGNSAETVRRVRDPILLAEALRQARIPSPKLQTCLTRGDGHTWLQKSPRSAGGRNIAAATGSNSVAEVTAPPGCYFQQRIIGQPVSALYVAFKNESKLLGMTAQLIGSDGTPSWWCTEAWSGAKGFWYAGSIGPLTEPAWMFNQAAEIGQCVARAFGLVGLFGIDAILTEDALWPLEVNPRYTASIEILERATGMQAVDLHARSFCERAFDASSLHSWADNFTSGVRRFAKAVLYATNELQVTSRFAQWAADVNSNCHWPTIADIPSPGAIASGSPICTVFTDSGTSAAALVELRAIAKRVAICLE